MDPDKTLKPLLLFLSVYHQDPLKKQKKQQLCLYVISLFDDVDPESLMTCLQLETCCCWVVISVWQF